MKQIVVRVDGTSDRQVKNPKTAAQTLQRVLVKVVALFYSMCKYICNHSFEGVSNGRDCMNKFKKVNRIPMSQLTDKSRGTTYKMYNHKKPIFVCPVHKDDALLTAYEDDRGKQYFRLDDVPTIEEGKMLSSGNTLTDVSFSKVFFCEIISKRYHEDLHRIHNMKRTSLGFQALTGYGLKEQEAMRKIGIDL